MLACAFVHLIPSRARRSQCGVRILVEPYENESLYPRSPAKMITIFGLFGCVALQQPSATEATSTPTKPHFRTLFMLITIMQTEVNGQGQRIPAEEAPVAGAPRRAIKPHPGRRGQ